MCATERVSSSHTTSSGKFMSGIHIVCFARVEKMNSIPVPDSSDFRPDRPLCRACGETTHSTVKYVSADLL